LNFDLTKNINYDDRCFSRSFFRSGKANFYKKTYLHVALSILAFIGVETILLKTVPVEVIAMMFQERLTWLLIIGVFWLASF
jgi:FtsH-binding integral membrane protein